LLFLQEVMDKIVFSSLISFNGMLTSHRDNLSTHHYHVTYHPCFDTQFPHSQTTQHYFCAVAISSRKKRKRLSCPFVPKRLVKRKQGDGFDKDWADKTEILAKVARILDNTHVPENGFRTKQPFVLVGSPKCCPL